jgi:hypothetical protein
MKRATGTLRLIVVPVIVPGDFYVWRSSIARKAADEPLSHVEGKRVLHRCARDTSGVEVVERRHVHIRSMKFLNTPVERGEKIFDAWDERWRARKSTQKEQAFVKANELARIIELQLREFGQESGNDGNVRRIELIFGGFQLI